MRLGDFTGGGPTTTMPSLTSASIFFASSGVITPAITCSPGAGNTISR